ncbi:unnamed protein product, partial [Polarella glacialis]
PASGSASACSPSTSSSAAPANRAVISTEVHELHRGSASDQLEVSLGLPDGLPASLPGDRMGRQESQWSLVSFSSLETDQSVDLSEQEASDDEGDRRAEERGAQRQRAEEQERLFPEMH